MTAKHLSNTNEQYTPPDLVEMVREVLGGIDLDPASSELANHTVQASQIFTEADGEKTFHEDWCGRVFMNPPGGTIPVVQGCGIRSNPALFWSKLMYEWSTGNTQVAVVVGFTVEVLQTTQGVPGVYPMLRFPLCFPRRRLRFWMPREARISQLQEQLAKQEAGSKKAKVLARRLEKMADKGDIVEGDSPPHGNVLVLVPPRDEQHFGQNSAEVRWGGPMTLKFQEVFAKIGYVRV